MQLVSLGNNLNEFSCQYFLPASHNSPFKPCPHCVLFQSLLLICEGPFWLPLDARDGLAFELFSRLL